MPGDLCWPSSSSTASTSSPGRFTPRLAPGEVGGVEVGEWKPFFHGAVALELARVESPFLFAIDANEPLRESADEIVFHWEAGRPGVAKLKALLGKEPAHRARDLFREWFVASGDAPASEELLLATYGPSPEFQRRFDSIWATDDFSVDKFTTEVETVTAAGGDHALLVAELQLN